MKYYSVRQLSRKLDVSDEAIYQKIRSKEMKAVRVDFFWIVPTDEVERWIRLRHIKRRGKLRKI